MLITLLTWGFRLVLFGLFFVFALQNRHTIHINSWFGNSVNTPMVIALGCAALFGILLGMMIVAPRLLRYRQQRNDYRNRLMNASSKHITAQHPTPSTNTVYNN